jgi:hypothetical protein
MFLKESPAVPWIVWFNDEDHIHWNGYVNAQNKHMWANEHLHIIMEALLPVKKCIAWCGIIGPISLGDIVIADYHLHALQEELVPFL